MASSQLHGGGSSCSFWAAPMFSPHLPRSLGVARERMGGGLFVVCWCVDVGAGRAYSTDPDFHQDGKFLGHNESLRRLLVR